VLGNLDNRLVRMAAAKSSHQDFKDLEKYLRHFVYKSAQVIVQSRLGERMTLPSKQFATGADWFNLTIHDDADVLSEVKRIYPGLGGGLAGGDIVCIETLLRTASGSAVLLENWTVKLVSPCDSTVRVSFTVYNRIGILLKSLLIVTRSVPAYQLSRRCCSKTCDYGIYYRVYIAESTLDLGSSFGNRTIGLVPTPVGTIHLSVAYRAQPSLESDVVPTRDLELRDDHFCADTSSFSSGKITSCWHAVSKWQQFVDAEVQDHEQLSASPPDHDRMVSIPSDLNRLVKDVQATRSTNGPRIAAFASSDRPTPNFFDFDIDANLPFGRLLEHDMLEKTHKNSGENLMDEDLKMRNVTEPVMLLASSGSSMPNQAGCGAAPDVTHTLKTPFASCTVASGNREQEGDLGRFYRECQSAPSLSMFQHPPADVRELLKSITDQLTLFEANAKEFDEFVNSFQES